MHRLIRKHAQNEDGFSLLELLIVTAVLAVLAGIAVFSVRPFQTRAETACFTLEQEMARVVEAAQNAAIGGDELQSSMACVDVALAATAASENCCSEVNLATAPSPGHTIVAISGHRGSSAGNPTISGEGWTLRGVFNNGLGAADARGVAVWTKVAGPGEPTFISVDWGPGNPPNFSKSLLVQVYNRSLTHAAIGSNHNGAVPGTSLSLGAASLSEGPGLVVVGLATRGSHGPTVTWGGVTGIAESLVSQDSSIHTRSAWAAVQSALGPHEVTAQWTNAVAATGFTMVMRP